jgi:hypothetical protein
MSEWMRVGQSWVLPLGVPRSEAEQPPILCARSESRSRWTASICIDGTWSDVAGAWTLCRDAQLAVLDSAQAQLAPEWHPAIEAARERLSGAVAPSP